MNFANRLSRSTEIRKDTTSISGALLFAQELLNMRRDRARKLVLDVSGDGPQTITAFLSKKHATGWLPTASSSMGCRSW